MGTKKYITTPIYYVNGNPHVGHAHTSVMGDILKRQYKLQGKEVFFTTGVDEHGQKNQTTIEASGLSAKEYLDKQSEIFKGLFDLLNIDYDKYVRTTAPDHIRAVQYVLNYVYEKGLIVKKEYEGLYCVGCEMFKTASDLDENGLCADHQTKPVLMKESNYFFTMEPFRQWLIDYINEHPNWISPTHFKNDILHLLEQPLPDLCISRTKERCNLGIELPFDKDYVAYVWFDALINYISSLGYPQNNENVDSFWGNSTHLMAKDIIKTHCIYWPIMLKAIGLEPQTNNLIHGYWTGEGGIKMSKSIGNVVDPYKVVEEFGVDPFRYFLARTMGENESSMSYELIKTCYNTEIVNTISNAIYRTMKLAYKFYDGCYTQDVTFREEDEEFLKSIATDVEEANAITPSLTQIYNRTELIFNIAKRINVFFDQSAPWVLAKKEDLNDFNSCIYTCVEALRLMAELSYPIMPETSKKILSSLGFEDDCFKNYVVVCRKIKKSITFDEPTIIYQRKE